MFFRRQLRPQNTVILPSGPGQDIHAQSLATDILARTIWGEARGEPLAGKEAVANVVMNRIRLAQRRGGKFWWGHDIESVCRRPKQFSCWNENDPNYLPLLSVGAEDAQFATCLRIARRAVHGTLVDNTFGADHYHAETILPKWAAERKPISAIGNHLFYKLEA